MQYEKGKIIIGQVIGITEYGAFVKFKEDYVGLLHISEMSEKYVNDIRNYVQEEEYIYVKILDVDNERKQLKLSIKGINYKKINFYDKHNKIIETASGFGTLRKKLNCWIKDYLKNKKINKSY